MIDGYYIGLMSGTSIDSIDGALVKIEQDRMHFILSESIAWDKSIQKDLKELCKSTNVDIQRLYELKNHIAKTEANVVNNLLLKSSLSPQDIIAIGSHGQTIRHRPDLGFSIQLDNGPMLSALSNIDSIVDFRSYDIAKGGQGAPLAQIFHKKIFSCKENDRLVLNLGGISNITVLDHKENIICSYDIGPANCLIDRACSRLFNVKYDHNGDFAKLGKVNEDILKALLDHEYFKLDYPKSTGTETFGDELLEPYYKNIKSLQDKYDFICTLSMLSVQSIYDQIYRLCDKKLITKNIQLIICGGGAYNQFIVTNLTEALSKLNIQVLLSSDLNIDPKYIECQAFAYFAYLNVNALCVNLEKLTGSKGQVILGVLSPSTNGFYSRSRHDFISSK